MTPHDMIRVACPLCNAHGELWNEECQMMKVCTECLGGGWLMDDRLHIPSPNPNPDELFSPAEPLPEEPAHG